MARSAAKRRRLQLAPSAKAIASDFAESAERGVRASLLGVSKNDALFVVDDAGAHGRGPASRKRRREEMASAPPASASSNAELIAAALRSASRVKFLQAKVAPPPAPLSKGDKVLVDRVTLQLANKVAAAPSRAVRCGATGDADIELRDVWGDEDADAGGDLIASAPGRKGRDSKGGGAPRGSVGAALMHPKRILNDVAARTTAPRAPPSRRAPLLGVPTHAGASYNPSLEAHQDLLQDALAMQSALDAEYSRQQEDATRALGDKKRAAPQSGALVTDAGEVEEEESDDEEEDEGGQGAGGATGGDADADAPSTVHPTAATKQKLTVSEARRARLLAARARRKATLKGAAAVDAAVSNLEAEEAAIAAALAHKKRVAAEAEIPKALLRRANAQPVLAVPLSEELTGSLRTLTPVSSGQLLMTAMSGIAARGDVSKRKSAAHVLVVPGATPLDEPTVTTQTAAAVHVSRRVGKSFKLLEFPRRKQFVGAEKALEEAGVRIQ